MNCSLCGEPVVLVPSATERAAKVGETPAFYTRLFPDHADCLLAKWKAETSALCARIRNKTITLEETLHG